MRVLAAASLRWIVVMALAIALALVAYRYFLPSEEQRIHRMLAEVAQAASIPTASSPLGNLAAAQKLADFCSQDVEIHFEAPGYGQHSFSGRDEVLQAALAARANLPGLKVEFVDVKVQVNAPNQSAVADLTAKVTRTGERGLNVEEFKLQLKKLDARWRITRVETVRTVRL